METADSGSGGGALELFADWLSRREKGELVEFETLVQEHPGHAAELAELHATWKRLAAASDPANSSVHERISTRFGKQSLSEVSLREQGGEEAKSELASALIMQLSAPGSRFGRYKIRGEVARGGMGAILKIWDADLRRHLAMKVILGQADARQSGETPPVDSLKVARFLEEAQVTGQLDHPGIVPVHELGLDPEGRLYFTMKLVKGESLHTICEQVFEGKDGWTETRALNVLLKVCEAMAYAHDKGVIHRDLKPANVMVGKFGEVHVMDWGLARIEGQQDRKDIRIRDESLRSAELQGVRADQRSETPDSPLCTMDGDVVGTPAYMPPEQAAGKTEEVGAHSDVYALGAMIYHLLAGHPPYIPKGARLNNHAIWARVQEGPPTPIAQLAAQAPAEVVAICDKAMARDWRQRYRDMSELAEDLSAYLNQRVVRAYETGTWAETRKWVKRNKPLAASLAAAIVILAVGVAGTSLFAFDAREQSSRAIEQERIATRRAADLLSLSAIEDLKELETRADLLWPADPEMLPGYENWISDARTLIDGRRADLARGVKARFSLLQHEAKLAEIRKQAKPLTSEQIAADRRANPSTAALERARAQLQWMRRMLAEEPWPATADVEAALAKEGLPSDARALDAIASSLANVNADTVAYGTEIRGLIVAQRALAAASDAERTEIRNTLAWSLLRCGQVERALIESRKSLDEGRDEEKEKLEVLLLQLTAKTEEWRGEQARKKQSELATKMAERIVLLQGRSEERQTYEFEDEEVRWWHARLSQLVTDLKSFTDENAGGLFSSGTSDEHGWGIVKRAKFARTIADRSTSSADARRRWDEATAAIEKSGMYGGLKLTPQIGLLPIGEDPDSHLWEFAHLQTGEPAQRGTAGKLVLSEETGLVFVLIPGGTFLMGAQSRAASEQNHDPQALGWESPPHEVTLSPYLLSKYEMTQGQWVRSRARNPSDFGPGAMVDSHAITLLNPVEQVTWTQCRRVMLSLGLELPSEAQWENSCRAGTQTIWWTGSERESLRGMVNIADRTAGMSGATWPEIHEWPDLDDGWATHAAVGSFPANPFGLHEVSGNVFEWCLDGNDQNWYVKSPKLDPVAPWSVGQNHVGRGGAFSSSASYLRSANRSESAPEFQRHDLGLRPARAIRSRP